ncbi:FAS1 domain-containing protein [Hyaloraphidium curvatum]|nr:FAS1 domain-containing protein [Hyaloraphidium curvatum]
MRALSWAAAAAALLAAAAPAAAQNYIQAMQAVSSGQLVRPYNLSTMLGVVQSVPYINQLASGQVPGLTNITMYAPTNAAFQTLAQQIAESGISLDLTNEADRQQLLLYHFSPYYVEEVQDGVILPTMLQNGSFTNLNPQNLVVRFRPNQGPELIHGLLAAGVIDTIITANGPMNVLDQVLVPPVTPVLTLTNAGLTEFLRAAQATSLMPALNTLPGVTMFVPNNAAITSWIASQNATSIQYPSQIADVLRYHVVQGVLYSYNFTDGVGYRTAQGDPVFFSGSIGNFSIGNAKIIVQDLLTTNGVIHVIDQVLDLPYVNPVLPPAVGPDGKPVTGAAGRTSATLLAGLLALVAAFFVAA